MIEKFPEILISYSDENGRKKGEINKNFFLFLTLILLNHFDLIHYIFM